MYGSYRRSVMWGLTYLPRSPECGRFDVKPVEQLAPFQ